MGNDLKDSWKQTGIGLGHAFRDLGKSIVKSGTYGLKKAEEWANGDQENAPQAENTANEVQAEVIPDEKVEIIPAPEASE